MNKGLSSLPKIPELNKRLLFVAFMLIVYRLGVFVPIPGVDSEQILEIFNQQASGTIFDMLNLFSGGA
ncbi:MAG: preprotein translocase subunit SecY, partial [Candidatus Dadabacteria bacterium]|nr:preprotein translocase subunit SecY [Candidatus Dadabacteria bacterium]